MTVDCRTTHDLFSDYYDGGLSAADRRLLEDHLKSCPGCTTEFRHFTESLDALHRTRPLETTRIFMANVRSAAAAHLDRKENLLRSEAVTIQTPRAEGSPDLLKAESRPPKSSTGPVKKAGGLPAWVPWSLAATTLAAFLLGFLSSGRGDEQALADLQRKIEQLMARPPERVPVPVPADVDAALRERGFVQVDGQWLPARMRDDFAKGLVYVQGRPVAREDLARTLAKEFPPEPPPPPPPAPVPSADEILERAGYAKVNEVTVPREWIARWAQGDVLVGVNEWRRSADFRDQFIRDHHLVEYKGQLMTAEQAESLRLQQSVRMPEGAPPVNEFTRTLVGLEVGPPKTHAGITVYPILAPQPPADSGVLPLHAALGGGKVEISDTLGLFAVLVRNGLESDLLLVAGEVLTGGRCSRAVAQDTLVPGGQTVRVPVQCVEPGTWRPGDRFAKESGHYVAPPQARRSLAWEQGQGATWSMLSRRLGGRSGQADLFRAHADSIAEARAELQGAIDREPQAVGLAVAIGDSLEFVELFQDRGLAASYFDRVVAGAALEALERAGEPARPATPFPNSIRGVKEFLESCFHLAYEPLDEGLAARKEDGWVGRMLTGGGGVRHALLFARGAPAWERRAPYSVPADKLKRAIDDYETRMKGLGPSRKIAALRDLGSINAPEVIPALLRHLTETDTAVRRAVIQELGALGDLRATDPLLQLLGRSRPDLPVSTEIARALGRLGDERSVDPLLKYVETGEPDFALALIPSLAELILQVRNRELLQRAMTRLLVLFETAEGVTRGEGVLDPVWKNLRPADAQAIWDGVRTTLKQVVGVEYSTAARARGWWNERESRERFLKDRTGK